MWLVAGLGNPGPGYADNRHNIGFMVVDELCRRWQVTLRAKFGSEVASSTYRQERVCLQKPMEYMNLSGGPVQRAAAFFQVDSERIMVVHDEIDLPFGRLKVKAGGGHGGHNGLRSVSEHLGPDYLRIRCGVGRPGGGKERVVGHVLGPFSKAERAELPFLIGDAADAVEAVIEHGVAYAMNRYNKSKDEKEPAG